MAFKLRTRLPVSLDNAKSCCSCAMLLMVSVCACRHHAINTRLLVLLILLLYDTTFFVFFSSTSYTSLVCVYTLHSAHIPQSSFPISFFDTRFPPPFFVLPTTPDITSTCLCGTRRATPEATPIAGAKWATSATRRSWQPQWPSGTVCECHSTPREAVDRYF